MNRLDYDARPLLKRRVDAVVLRSLMSKCSFVGSTQQYYFKLTGGFGRSRLLLPLVGSAALTALVQHSFIHGCQTVGNLCLAASFGRLAQGAPNRSVSGQCSAA